MNKILDILEKNQILILFLFIITALLLYCQIITAPPIWDDHYFIFDFIPFKEGISHFDIWKNYAWPLSSSLYKTTLSLFGRNYYLYHLTNIVIHALNSYLVFKIIKKLNLQYALLTSAIFLIHPANIISVAWIIQLKTLVAFTFFALSTWSYIHFLESKKKMHLAFFLLFFIFSVLTKSTALFFPIALFVIHVAFKKINKKFAIAFILFFIVSFIAGIKLMKSPLVTKINSVNDVFIGETLYEKFDFATQTIWYYLEQSFLPSSFVPVKGIIGATTPLSLMTLASFLITLMILLFLLDFKIGLGFICSLIMMSPFLGLVKAPFMKITSVSDQHLYLILPILIWVFSSVLHLLIRMISIATSQKEKFLALLFISFSTSYFASSTFIHSETFKNEEIFYQRSLEYNPRLLFLYINLSSYYQDNNDIDTAMAIINRALEMAQENPELKNNDIFGMVGAKWFELEQILRRREALEKN